ncbi:MAG TPA: arginine--tRNA ligase, partial [Ruminococcaceae bacterium]|nr:arginine--tRNA ligase [Oscillospiraceae bacterium]
MSKLVLQIESELRARIKQALETAIKEGELAGAELPDFSIEIPGDSSHGDYSTNAAMAGARGFKCAPMKIAQCILKYFEAGKYFSAPVAAGPGFINFSLTDAFFAEVLMDIAVCGESYGRSDFGGGKKVMVEFVSANPTGPMHIGNARGGALGDCLAGVLDFAGYNVSREFYINDAGNQIERFGASLDARYRQLFMEGVPFPEDGYQGEDIKDRAGEFAKIHGDAYLKTDSEERVRTLTDYALKKNIEALKEDLGSYRIEYDVWFRESSLYESGELDETIALMKQRGLTYEKEGALWYKATEYGGEKDEVLIRQNGNPTYFAADIAYHRNKLLTRGFDLAIDVWGADHHGHVARMKGVLDAIGLGGSRLDVVLMQLVRLMRDGEAVKVSKRTGKSITLKTLLDEVPVDAARFFFNMREHSSHLEFDLDLAVEQSNQNPVYYTQYAHARICSILRNIEKEGIHPREVNREELLLLTLPEERELIRHLASLTSEIILSAKQYDPSRITR